MKTICRIAYLLFVAPIFIHPVQAQPLYFLIDEELVKPGMEEQYRSAAKERSEQAKENQFGYVVHAARMESRYFYFIPLRGMGEFDEFMQEYKNFVGKNSELMNRINATLQERNSSLALLRSDLSYEAQNPRHSMEDITALRFIIMRPKLDKAQELESSLKDFTKMLGEHSIPDTHFILQQVIGQQTPHYLITYLGKDADELSTINHERDEKLGESGKSLGQSAESLVEKLESFTLQVERDLDHEPDQR